MAFQLSGNIQNIPLPAVLQDIHEARASGTFKIRRDGVEKSIYFRNGQIIFATSTDSHDRLGEILVSAGFLTRENLEAGLAIYRRNAGLKKIGAVLVENGYVSPKNLFVGLKTQVKDIIYSLFLWENAEYRFEENMPGDIIQLQINLPELISEIIDRIRKEC
jgi:hypothetical protein